MKRDVVPSRQIHLDFHTGPNIPDVGSEFDAETFAQTLADAHVSSVTLFAKCHHGHLYYDTKRPERHPTLPRKLNLLEEQIEACHRHGIRTPIYLSVQCDEYAANTHKDWIAVNLDGSPVGPKAFEPGWQILDMSSPYADFLAEQIEEVVRNFKPVDGIFLDMCWDQPSISKWAIAGMEKAGLNPQLEPDRAQYALQVVHGYMKRYNDLIHRVNGARPRIWYNSRPKVKLVEEAKFCKHVEIEALPTGGWGYTYFPLNARFARNFGLPFLGMTARFHKSWSDFGGLKPTAALKYECMQMIAQGASACIVGDQLHPRGTLDRGAYELIGQVYGEVKAIEPYFKEATPVTEIAVLRPTHASYHVQPGDALEGVVRLLQQKFAQFDFVHEESDLSRYPLVIVPECMALDQALTIKLIHASRSGITVILIGADNIMSASGALRKRVGLGSAASPEFKTVFLRYDKKQFANMPDSDHVLYEPTLRLSPLCNAITWVTVWTGHG